MGEIIACLYTDDSSLMERETGDSRDGGRNARAVFLSRREKMGSHPQVNWIGFYPESQTVRL